MSKDSDRPKQDKYFDYIIIGSGFGGSVSAMRLAEKGYSVLVIEKGKRYLNADFPTTNWNLKKYLWAPMIRCFGIQKISFLKDVLVLSGTGVGGGSLVYANTLLEPGDSFYNSPHWKNLSDWKTKLAPFYIVAKKMLGVTQNPRLTEVDLQLEKLSNKLGCGSSFKPVDVAVYFAKPGEEGKTVSDPYFGGRGPDRAGCNYCGGCMVGCRFNAKNTLDKNYLYFAEKLGAKIEAETEVIDIRSLESGEYEVETVCSTAWFKNKKKLWKSKGIVLAGGVLGTVPLLFRCKYKTQSLKNISMQLGQNVRTNSEALIGVSSREKSVDWSQGIAITSRFYPEPNTHIEPVRYSKGSSFMRFLSAPMVDDGGPFLRPLKMFLQIFKRPRDTLSLYFRKRWAETSIILLVMQSLDNKMKLVWNGWSVQSSMNKGDKVPSYIPIAHKVARTLSEMVNGIPQSAINEVLLQIPTTAHILGGCTIGESAESGVVDKDQNVFGYKNFYICDGSTIPANLGVNPSLTIAAMTELAMSKIPEKSKQSNNF